MFSLTELNGTRLDDLSKLQQTLAALSIGAQVQLTVFRENRQIRVDVNIVERPLMPWDVQRRRTDSPASGLAQAGTAALPGRQAANRRRVLF